MIPLPEIPLGRRSVFVGNLLFCHALMKATEGLLGAAADEAVGALRKYYVLHLEEERGHAEWLVEDLRALDVKPEMNFTAAMIAGSQYYHIFHTHPAMLLGYMQALERPMPETQVFWLRELYGEQATRTLAYHAQHDVDHARMLAEQVSLLSDEVKELVIQNRYGVSAAVASYLSQLR